MLSDLEDKLVIPDRVDCIAWDGLASLLGAVDRNTAQLDFDLRTSTVVWRTNILPGYQLKQPHTITCIHICQLASVDIVTAALRNYVMFTAHVSLFFFHREITKSPKSRGRSSRNWGSHPEFVAISNNFRLWSQISSERNKIPTIIKRRYPTYDIW